MGEFIRVADTTDVSPWHGWEYDVTTGGCMNIPAATVERYQVKGEGDDVKVLL